MKGFIYAGFLALALVALPAMAEETIVCKTAEDLETLTLKMRVTHSCGQAKLLTEGTELNFGTHLDSQTDSGVYKEEKFTLVGTSGTPGNAALTLITRTTISRGGGTLKTISAGVLYEDLNLSFTCHEEVE